MGVERDRASGPWGSSTAPVSGSHFANAPLSTVSQALTGSYKCYRCARNVHQAVPVEVNYAWRGGRHPRFYYRQDHLCLACAGLKRRGRVRGFVGAVALVLVVIVLVSCLTGWGSLPVR